MTADDLEALLRARRSVRRFRADPPPRDVIERLIDAAVTAPSASNKQPWRFLVVADRARIGAMAAAARAATARIALHLDPTCVEAFRAYGDYFTRFEQAPLVLVPLHRSLTLLSNMTGPTLDDRDRARIEAVERQSGLVGTSLALGNLLLMAHALGLGASGMTGPLLADDGLRELLEVQPSWGIVALVPVGWPDEAPAPTPRKPGAQVTRWVGA